MFISAVNARLGRWTNVSGSQQTHRSSESEKIGRFPGRVIDVWWQKWGVIPLTLAQGTIFWNAGTKIPLRHTLFYAWVCTLLLGAKRYLLHVLLRNKTKNSLFFSLCVAPQYMLRLQRGRFDSPDRTFSSIHETWNNTITLTTDVKEVRALPVEYIRFWFKFLICCAAAHSRILWTWMERLFAQLSKASSGRPNQWTGSGWCWTSPVGDRSQRFCSKDATSARVWLRTTTFTPLDWPRFWVQTTWRGGSQGQQWYPHSSSFQWLFVTDTHPRNTTVFYHLTYEGAVDIDTITGTKAKFHFLLSIWWFDVKISLCVADLRLKLASSGRHQSSFSHNPIRLMAPQYP